MSINQRFEQLFEDDNEDETKAPDQLINFIVQNFYRFINNPQTKDDRSLLMLTAALATLGASGGNPQGMQAARRLAQIAISRRGK